MNSAKHKDNKFLETSKTTRIETQKQKAGELFAVATVAQNFIANFKVLI